MQENGKTRIMEFRSHKNNPDILLSFIQEFQNYLENNEEKILRLEASYDAGTNPIRGWI